jgi:hypothetical protein
MTDKLDEAARERAWKFDELMRRNPECPSAPEREEPISKFLDPARFERWAAQRAEKDEAEKAAKRPEPKPELAPDWGVLDERIAAVVEETVGPAIDRIVERVNEEINHEHDALTKLEDRVRELLIENSKALSNIARLEVSIAHLELRIATADRRGGATIDASPSLKSIN